MTALAARMGVTPDSLTRVAGPLVIVMILATVVAGIYAARGQRTLPGALPRRRQRRPLNRSIGREPRGP